MANRRLARLNEQLKREISRILRREVRDPRVGVPTVTGVEVTPDLWNAKVHVRLTGEREEREEALAGLEAAAPFVRKHLGDLRLRRIPELRFVEDRTLDHARRIEAILDEVAPEGEAAGEDAPDEASPGEIAPGHADSGEEAGSEEGEAGAGEALDSDRAGRREGAQEGDGTGGDG